MARANRTRRQVLRQFTTVGAVSTVVPGSVAATGDATAGAQAARIGERRRYSYEGDGRLVSTFEYDLPRSLTELTAEDGALGTDDVTVLAARNFERRSETTFVWSGGEPPRLRLAVTIGGDTIPEGKQGYVADRGALAAQVVPSYAWRYDGTEVTGVTRTATYDGEGFAGTGLVYAGPHERVSRVTGGVQQTVVVATTADRSVDAAGILETFRVGERHFAPRLDYDRTTAIVVPSARRGPAPPGVTIRQDVLLFDGTAALDGIANVPTHEYCHAIYGVFGTDEMYWLKEGLAEYGGYLLSLHAGLDTYSAFLDAVRTEEYRDATLSSVGPRDDTLADYQKGAHVLAALDGEIRTRSTDDRTLFDVVGTDEFDLSTFDGFADAVVAAAGDESIRDWLDRYVRSSATPDVPTDPDRYTLGATTPSAFRTTTPTPSETPTPMTTGTTAAPTAAPTATSTPSETGPDDDTTTSAAGPGFALAVTVAGFLGGVAVAGRRADERTNKTKSGKNSDN